MQFLFKGNEKKSNANYFWGRVIYQRKKTEPSVLLLSLGFEKPKFGLGLLMMADFFFFSPGYALPVVG